jgi:DNA-binding Lrp family transcriptional regulator
LRFTAEQLARLRDVLGVTPAIAGFSAIEVRVLAALARAPAGLVSVRALAGRAGVSPTAASRAVQRLVEQGLVVSEERIIAAGHAKVVRVMRANVLAPEWPALAAALSRVVVPRRDAKQARRVPPHLRHLFWNADHTQLNVADAGGYIARRLLTTGDLDGLAWGATQLSADDWKHAALARGVGAEDRALARNIAAARTLVRAP